MVPAWLEQICPVLPPRLAVAVRLAVESLPADDVCEVRLRATRPLMLRRVSGEVCLKELLPTAQEIYATFSAVTRSSVYALEPQLAQGYITLPGGHRAGLCGHMAATQSGVRIGACASINLRIAREVRGCALPLLPHLLWEGWVCSTLIVSPPGLGKTTLLRDLVRCLGDGLGGCRAHGVAVADERGELAACKAGIPQLDVGMRTDVLEGIPKAVAAGLLLRGMAPQALAMDELACSQDWQCVQYAAEAGVAVLATAHGATLAGLRRRAKHIGKYIGAFERCVTLEGRGRIASVTALPEGEELMRP